MFIKDTEFMAIENRNSKQSQEAKVAGLTICENVGQQKNRQSDNLKIPEGTL